MQQKRRVFFELDALFYEKWIENELDVVFGYFDFERIDFQEEVSQVKWVTKD